MQTFLNTPFKIGSLTLPNRLIQGPLAGVSTAAFRRLVTLFTPPAYCVSEMLSAYDVLTKHNAQTRYLYRAADETRLCYQIAGTDPDIMARAAAKLEDLGADLIDINCGRPKNKIRKKGAGSALLEEPNKLLAVIQQVRNAISCPLTVKIRLLPDAEIHLLAQKIAAAGADALIIHGRNWTQDYDEACDWQQIAQIKKNISIPVIVNGDISNADTAVNALRETGGDGLMISRAGTGQPWLFQELLEGNFLSIPLQQKIDLFMQHLQDLSFLENDYSAVLQSKSLVRYYFRQEHSLDFLNSFYQTTSLKEITAILDLLMAATT